MIETGDVFIAISYSGASDELLDIVPLVKRRGARLIAITGNPQSAPDQRDYIQQLRSEEHTSELQSRQYLVCRLLLEKKKKTIHARQETGQRRRDELATPCHSVPAGRLHIHRSVVRHESGTDSGDEQTRDAAHRGSTS